MLYCVDMNRKYHYFTFAILALATTICYWPGLSGPFLFDDLPNILANSKIHITSLTWESITGAINSVVSGPLKRPISMASFALNYYFFGLSPFSFKVVNLIIHILNAVALYGLAILLLSSLNDQPRRALSIKHIFWIAAGASLLWAIHPLNISSVLYIVQRMTSLASLFTTLGLIGYCLGRNELVAGKSRGIYKAVGSIIVFGSLAVLSKENGALIFLYALVIEAFIYRFSINPALDPRYRKTLMGFYMAPVVIGLIVLMLYGNSLLSLDHYEVRQFTLTERLMTEARIIWFYLSLIAAPTLSALGLHHDYIAFSTSLTQPITTLVSIIALLLLTITGIVTRKHFPLISFAIFWFLFGHSLESSVIPLELVHEHRNYLPMFGPVLAATYYLLYHAKKPESLKLWTGLFIFIVLLFGTATYARSYTWSDSYRMKLKQLLDHPTSARANSDMAILLHSNQQLEEAGRLFVRAAELDQEPPHQLLRLLEHMYLTNKPVPQKHLDFLDVCANNTPYSQVTIWQYEEVLKKSRRVPADHIRILHAFESMVRSGRVKLSRQWAAKSHYLLGDNYMHLKSYKQAIAEFKLAADTDTNPIYLLHLANAYHHADNTANARATLKKIKDRSQLPGRHGESYDALVNDLKQEKGGH